MSRELPSHLFLKQPAPSQLSHPLSQELSLGELFGIVLDSKWLVLFLAALGVLAAFAQVSRTEPVYRVDALVQSESDKKSVPLLTDISDVFDTPTTGATEIELIKSRSNLDAAVSELHLDIIAHPNKLPILGQALFRNSSADEPQGAPAFIDNIQWLKSINALNPSRFAWGGEKITVNRLDLEYTDSIHNWIIVSQGNNKFELYDNLGVSVASGIAGTLTKAHHESTGNISLFVSEIKGLPGVEFPLSKINRISAIESLKSRLSVTEKGKKTGVLEISLNTQDKALGEAIVNLIANNYLRRTVEQKSQEAAQMLSFIETSLPELKAKLDSSELALERHQRKHGVVDVTMEAQAIIGSSADIEKQIAILNMEKAELSKRFTNNHPALIALNEKLGGLRSRTGGLSAKLRTLPAAELATSKLRRDMKVAGELYVTLLNKAQELKIAKAGTIGSISIVDTAATHPRAIGTNPVQIIALGLLLGLAAGVFLAITLKRMRKGLSDADEIEQKCDTPVFASIPISKAQSRLNITRHWNPTKKKDRILARVEPKDIAIEAIRSLRTGMQFSSLGEGNKVITISGPAPSLGKSFVAVNLATVMADSGKKVLLIDADIRKGYLHKYFNLERTPGLTELTSKQASLRECIHKYEGKFHFLPSGSFPENPSETLLSEEFKQLIKSARKIYDHIIIDTPPILAVTDPTIVGKYSDSIYLVLKANEHHEKEINAALKPFNQVGLKVTGLVVNMLPIEKQSKYGYRSQNNYQYSYK